MPDFAADDFAFIHQRWKEIKGEMDSSLAKPAESEQASKAQASDPNKGDELAWDYYCC